ncbi:Peptidase_G2, IMC autoproteolytic cleavage domain [Alteribacillus bidgolensis]|uniref:Peptidase_G2, IMC autoproteolytic cleavage domain n=2 Tax=Alteribacillus bidgolensis TaxID=930129 RepID=A0A1G8SC00_9BACI|nr:peptidase G2 autoproteolytic cleavage domain-containing protein [Alteribacillus bidgolensis]SDJ26742.1 Peptidase_G2, IMC autoproteolytic cleavage domain [Alteribacillus bidgolensis]
MFETSNGEPIGVGYFVTFDEGSEKIRVAHARDDYIIGITSSNPAILSDSQDPDCSKYVIDEWNRPVYEEVTIPAVKDHEGNVLTEERKKTRKKINPNWDPSKNCSSRLDKPEWVAVGLVGKLLVRDDGTCQPGSYCKPNDDGIATKASQGYRVMKRTGENQILVLLNSTLETTNIEQLKQLASDQQSVEGMERLINLKEKSIEQLERLAKIKEQGYLTEEEFQIEKQKLLDS